MTCYYKGFYWKKKTISLNSRSPILFSQKLLLCIYRNPNIGTDGQTLLTIWPEYDVTSEICIRFKGGLGDYPIETRYIADRMNFWHNFVPVVYERCDKECETCPPLTSSVAVKYGLSYLLLFLALANTVTVIQMEQILTRSA